MNDTLLTVDEAAEFYRVTPEAIRRMVRDERIPAHSLPGGRNLRFRKAELAAALESVGADPEGGDDA